LISVFAILIIVQEKYLITNINQIYLIKYYNKLYYYCLLFNFFALAGIPPLSGFFTKYLLFLRIYTGGQFFLALLALVASLVMAVIYLQLALQLVVNKPGHAFSISLEHSKLSQFDINFYTETAEYRK